MKGILKDKLDQAEMPVPDQLWAQVSSQLSAAPATTGLSTAAWTKVAVWIVGAIAATTAAVWVVQDQAADTAVIAKPAVEQPQTSTAPPANSTPADLDPVLGTVAANPPASIEVIETGPSDETTPMEQELPTQQSEAAIPDRAIEPAQEPAVPAANPSPAPWRTEEALPAASALFDMVKSDGSAYLFQAQESKHGVAYSWNFGDGQSAVGPQSEHRFAAPGEYWVTLTCTDEKGQQVSSQQMVAAQGQGEIQVVNVITPNNDGQNDVFDPSALAPQAQIHYLLVMSASGQKIYESSSTPVWDGKLPNGDFAPAGSYLYLIRGEDKNSGIIEKSARLTVIR